jgi:hypothetical protein
VVDGHLFGQVLLERHRRPPSVQKLRPTQHPSRKPA